MSLILSTALIGVASLGCDGQHAKQYVAAPAPPACPTAPVASTPPVAPVAPVAAVAPVMHKISYHPGPEPHDEIETLVLNKSGKSITLSNEGKTFVLYVDGERAAEFVGGDGTGLYQLVGSDGHEMGMIRFTGDSAMFSEDGDFGFDFDVDVEFDGEVATAPSSRGNGFFRAQSVDSGAPKVMMGVVMSSNAPRSVLREFGLEGDEVTVVSEVIRGLPAEKAGLMTNDVIVRVDGMRPAHQEAIRKVLREKNPGDVLALRVIRGKDLKELELHLTPYKRDALDGSARLEVEERASGANKELLEKIERLRDNMESLGMKMAHTSDSRKLSEMGAEMGRMGAELGMLSSKLAMQEMELNRLTFPNAPKPAQVIVPEWNGQGENRFRFLTVPGEGPALDELREIVARISEESEIHSEQYQERIEEMTERLAERTERQAEQMQERIERMVERMAREQERHADRFDEREDRTESLSERLEEMDARMARLEEMLAQLLKDRR